MGTTGGIIQFGEHPEEALVRRCREEIGIKINIVNIIPEVQSYVAGDNQLVLLHYLATTKDEKMQNLDDKEDYSQSNGWHSMT
jgi:ADP-ribose pyrophosphatase YjhB (NUDIX family)